MRFVRNAAVDCANVRSLITEFWSQIAVTGDIGEADPVVMEALQIQVTDALAMDDIDGALSLSARAMLFMNGVCDEDLGTGQK